jgi:hypothetical protein
MPDGYHYCLLPLWVVLGTRGLQAPGTQHTISKLAAVIVHVKPLTPAVPNVREFAMGYILTSSGERSSTFSPSESSAAGPSAHEAPHPSQLDDIAKT